MIERESWLPATETAAYGLVLKRGTRHDAVAPAIGRQRIVSLCPASLKDIPPLPDHLTVTAWQRSAATPCGWQIDVLAGPSGGLMRGWSLVLTGDGSRLLVTDATAGTVSDRRAFLTRVAIRSILARLGALLLHGNLSRGPTGAVAVLGDSGAGKSSLAIALMRAGAPPLADDVVCPVRIAGTWHAWPGHHEILAEGPTLDRLGIDRAAWPPLWERPIADEQKYRLTTDRTPDADAVPLAGIVVLEPRRSGGPPRMERIAPAAALAALMPHCGWTQDAGGRQARLADLASIAAEIPLWRLTRPDRIEALPATADLVLAALACPPERHHAAP